MIYIVCIPLPARFFCVPTDYYLLPPPHHDQRRGVCLVERHPYRASSMLERGRSHDNACHAWRGEHVGDQGERPAAHASSARLFARMAGVDERDARAAARQAPGGPAAGRAGSHDGDIEAIHGRVIEL